MIMNKRLVMLAGIGFGIVVLSLVTFVVRFDNRATEDTGTGAAAHTDIEETATVRFAAESEHNRAVRAQIKGKSYTFVDEAGIVTSVCPGYTPQSPLVEIIPKMRDLDGQVKPFQFDELSILGLNADGLGTYGHRGAGLRLQIDLRRLGDGNLLYGKEYHVVAAYNSVERRKFAPSGDSRVVFKTPPHLDAGEIYRVELILLDELAQARKTEEERFAKEEYESLAKEEAITIHAQYPVEPSTGVWAVSYAHEKGARQGDDRTGSGEITLPGPNPLNGELGVSFAAKGRPIRPWCYLANLQRRTVHLPQDADLVILQEDLALAYFDGPDRDVAVSRGFDLLTLHYSRDARLALFSIYMDLSRIPEPEPGGGSRGLPWAMLPPGTFHVRSKRRTPDGIRRVYLGTVEITGEAGKVYRLEFPPLPSEEGTQG